MKMKTFSKLMAIALMAIMTTCLTSCEDERTVPVQGSGIGDDGVHHQIVTEPKDEKLPDENQGADFMLVNAMIESGSDDIEYLILYTGITNLTNEEHTPGELLGVTAWYPDNMDSWYSGSAVLYATSDVGDFKISDANKSIKPGEQSLVIYAFELVPEEIPYVTIKAYDIKTNEVTFETNINLKSY